MGVMTTLIDDFISQHSSSDDATLARALVTEAGRLASRMRASGLSTDYKTSISDVVTEADRAAEKFVAGVLEGLRGDDGVLGEEGAARTSRTGRTWVIDPVDGTYNFTSGFSYYCSALALVEGPAAHPDRLLLGAVHRPEPGVTYLGGPERHTTVDGEPVAPLAEKQAAEISVASYLHPTVMLDAAIRDAWIAAISRFATVRMLGAGSVDLSLVASGKVGAWVQHSVADWDWLPGKALVTGAGGAGRKVEAGGVEWCVAGNRAVVDEICSQLAENA